MGPPMGKREGGEMDGPDVLKGWKNRKKEENEGKRKSSKKTRAGRFRKWRGRSRRNGFVVKRTVRGGSKGPEKTRPLLKPALDRI
ncbi:hypothetical protein TNCV_1099441 [Trichonephila clavipes]|nr:hypothetical protein TNCV_1099441 [Trichonephila clavipes]